MPEIRWRHDRSRLIVRAAILPPLGAPNESTALDVRALLDTGATSSGVTPRIADALGLPSLGKKPVQTAGGLIQTDRYTFRIGFYDGDSSGPTFPYVLEKTIFGIGLADSDSFQIIIGMDVIGTNRLEVHPDGLCVFEYDTSR